MKLVSAMILCGALVVFFTETIFAQDPLYVAKDNEEIYGTWVNRDYQPNAHPRQKIIIYPEEWAAYGLAESETATDTGTNKITDKWTDSEGNIWYKFEVSFSSPIRKAYELDKISNSGKTLEFVFSYSKYPTKIDTGDPDYHIYHRE